MSRTNEQTTVADAEQAIARLERKRDALVARGTELATNRASVAYKALNDDDATAKQKLDQINKESVSHSHELASVDAALVTARQKLEAAQRHEARAAQAEHARAIRSEWSATEKDFADLDQGLNLAADAARRLYDRYGRMQQHGFKLPPQLTLMLSDVVVSYLMAMPPPLWRQFNHLGLEHLPPNRRRNAASLNSAWGPQAERQTAAIGGEQQAQPNKSDEAA
jgi:hypothetical protein